MASDDSTQGTPDPGPFRGGNISRSSHSQLVFCWAPVPPAVFEILTNTPTWRHFGSLEGLEALSGNSSLSQPVPVVLFEESKNDDSEFWEFGWIYEEFALLEGLLSEVRNDDITKLSKRVEP